MTVMPSPLAREALPMTTVLFTVPTVVVWVSLLPVPDGDGITENELLIFSALALGPITMLLLPLTRACEPIAMLLLPEAGSEVDGLVVTTVPLPVRAVPS